jgi:hypothetical protein
MPSLLSVAMRVAPLRPPASTTPVSMRKPAWWSESVHSSGRRVHAKLLCRRLLTPASATPSRLVALLVPHPLPGLLPGVLALSGSSDRRPKDRGRPGRNGPGPISDDQTGTLANALRSEIDAAHRLLESAEVLMDEVGFERWREHFEQSRMRCGEVLRRRFVRGASEEFQGGTPVRFPSGQWRRVGERR